MLRGTKVLAAAGAMAIGLVACAPTANTGTTDPADRTEQVRAAVQGGTAKNVIFLLGDGMGDSEITLARYYAKGAAGRLNMDSLPMTGEVTTYAVKSGTADVPDYVPDSAATGSAWSTGKKTYNNAISVDPVTKLPNQTILELAQAHGKRTGNITTAELTDATPAVLDSHISLRGCQGPADMSTCSTEKKDTGGLGSIAEQTVDHGVDVLMGGGKARFDQTVTGGTYAGQTVVQQATALGYTVGTDQAALDASTAGSKFLGLFSPSNMDLEWTGPLASPYPGPAITSCTESNATRPSTMPHLADMTTKALELLTAPVAGDTRDGFFLQVEGASIDKQDHAANPCGQIGETIEFDRAIKVALDFAATHTDTLVVVTADHGHTSQIIDPQTAADHSPGSIATLTTHDGQPIVVNYATNLTGRSQTHTGTEVRVAAKGPQAANVTGIVDQTELFSTMKRALGIS